MATPIAIRKIIYCNIFSNPLNRKKSIYMGKKTQSIKQINSNWLRKKVKYAKIHKYGGDPIFMLDNGLHQHERKKSTQGNPEGNRGVL